MKSTSIISIFIALVLIVGGCILCAHARKTAPNDEAIDGNTLVSEDGDVVTEVALTGQTFTTVNVSVENCKVEIHGNAEASSITLINFNENTYIAAAGEKTLTISNKISLLDYINLDGTGVTFSGVWKTLRSFLNYDTSKGEREIHVYLGPDADISKISISCDSGSGVRLLDLDRNCDIAISSSSSTVELSAINAASMTVAGSTSDFSIGNSSVTSFEYLATDSTFVSSNLTAENVTVDSASSNVSLLDASFRNLSAELDAGDLVIKSKYDRASYFRKIAITEGEILLNGTPIGQKDESAEELFETLPGTMTVNVGVGKIDLTFGSEALPPVEEPDVPGTTPAA